MSWTVKFVIIYRLIYLRKGEIELFQRKDYKEKQLRYSIRKVSFGAASVAISALYLLMGSAAVSASEVKAVNGDKTTVTNSATKDN